MRRGSGAGDDGAHDAQDADDDAQGDRLPGDDLREEPGDVEPMERSSHELEEEPTMDARDALSQAIHGEPPANDTTRAAPPRVAVVELESGYFSPPARDPAFLADLYRAALYLDANGYLLPPTDDAGAAAWDRFLEAAEKTATPEQMDELLEVSEEWHPRVKSLIGSTIPPPAPKPRLDTSQAFLVGCLGFGLGALITHNSHKAREKRAALAAQAQASPAAPTVRPPYNPGLHGSLEAYRAAFAHLPGPLDAPGVVGLDRNAAASTPYANASQENGDREAAERKRRGW